MRHRTKIYVLVEAPEFQPLLLSPKFGPGLTEFENIKHMQQKD